jgi:hypothetical protein
VFNKYGFQKITPLNGFDTDPNNAMQNNYAWSMAELGDYLYVGTGRNILYNILLAVQNTGILGDFKIPRELTPKIVDNRAEIWRYNKALPHAGWQKVFKAPDDSNIIQGFRYMIRYTDANGQTALYVGGYCQGKVRTFRSTDGLNWLEIPNDNLKGTSTRAMVIHTNGKLYMSAVDEASPIQPAVIYEYIPPDILFPNGRWEPVTADPSNPLFIQGKNPSGQVMMMASFKGHLYAATTNLAEGFELWKTEGAEPKMNEWKLVIDKGAGDALNIIPLTLGIFRDYLYVGAIMFPLLAEQPMNLSAFKPFDVVRIDAQDHWQLVIGGKPKKPTNPTTGTRGKALSHKPSGLGNPFNLYCWQLEEYNGEFFLGTFDWSVLLKPLVPAIIPSLLNLPKLFEELLKIVLSVLLAVGDALYPFEGFDLYKSKDGIHWVPITLNGLGNKHNYGARLLFKSINGHLNLGTANPFDGCEVWKK